MFATEHPYLKHIKRMKETDDLGVCFIMFRRSLSAALPPKPRVAPLARLGGFAMEAIRRGVREIELDLEEAEPWWVWGMHLGRWKAGLENGAKRSKSHP